ncbi:MULTISPECIES: ABC transporter permease [unclassified Nocardioides]|uniref:ABC transporter permease n=1 Tax=unclassified Nocardioides TaxID=2615069 RepID=UPI000700C273|nr:MULTISPECIES: ABC transporter permease [unclassified Nocardioides]KQY64361.1 ABC transporter [Nocardioides sp. Root140]KRF18132.1 ABC transporter [Nocardioides sp. Soil796]
MSTTRQDFTPAPGSAPLSRQVVAQASMETRLLLRNGEQLLLAVVIPVLALVGGILAARRLGLDFDETPVDVLTPGVLALAVMSTSFTSLAIATGFERRYGLLKRLGASPLPRSGLLLGKVIALLGVQVLQAVVIGAVALGFGWRPGGGFAGVLLAVAAALLGTAAFAGLGLLVAGTLRAEATLAVANLVYLLLMMGGGIVLPRDTYGSAGAVIQFLPSAALGDAMRDAFIDGSVNLVAFAVLAVWAVAAGAMASRSFKWE